MDRAHAVVLATIFVCLPSPAQYTFQEAFPSLPSFSTPVELVHAGDGTDRLFVAEQRGRIYVFRGDPAVSERREFMKLSDVVSQSGSETGLLGLAFHPDYVNNRYFFVNYTSSRNGRLQSFVSRFQASQADPDSAVKASELILLTLDQPYSNHNGGKLAFGPDRFLYISFGDGGSANDPQGNGQNRATLLGKILRIDVDRTAGQLNYAIPSSNPFAQNTAGYREEIFAYGLRNPWKFSFDPVTGFLWAGDVGQGAREEIDIIVSGGNYGWRLMEGTICTPGVNPSCSDTAGLLRPVWDYDRSAGDVSVTGGYVYRGSSLPALNGKYVYGDFSSGRVWMLTYDGVNPTSNTLLQDLPITVSSFGVDRNNELYVCSYGTGRILKLTGPVSSTGREDLPMSPVLEQNYPNPFNPSTDIVFRLSNSAWVRLAVHDLMGRQVALLLDGHMEAGEHTARFQASGLASGVYTYRLTAAGASVSRAMVLVR